MAAKIEIKNVKAGTFGGIFSVMDRFDKSGMSELIDKTLVIRGITAKYSYSDIVKNIMAIYLCGGEAIEDVNAFRNEAFSANPDYKFCSADTILRIFRKLSVEDTGVESGSGRTYGFNVNGRLNGLLLKCLLRSNLIDRHQEMILDYDNQFIAAEKYDAKYSYKKEFGYFPGVAQLNLHPFYIENRDDNAPVKLEQDKTLKRMFGMLKDNNISIDKARMDCGSYSQDIVEEVAANSKAFYIRPERNAAQTLRGNPRKPMDRGRNRLQEMPAGKHLV